MNNGKSQSYTPWKKYYLHFKQPKLFQATQAKIN